MTFQDIALQMISRLANSLTCVSLYSSQAL